MSHQPWCASHLTDAGCDIDVCLGPEIHLHFGDRGTHAVACSHVATDLSQSRDNDHPAIMLHIDGEPVAELDRHQAAALAWALLSQDAQVAGDTVMVDYYRSQAEERAAAAQVRSTR